MLKTQKRYNYDACVCVNPNHEAITMTDTKYHLALMPG